MPITPITTIIPEYNIPVVGITAGTKFWIKGKIPPKIVSKPIAIVANFSKPKSMLFMKPYNNPRIPTAMIINWYPGFSTGINAGNIPKLEIKGNTPAKIIRIPMMVIIIFILLSLLISSIFKLYYNQNL